jgi:sugar lactone lactonase YvrE
MNKVLRTVALCAMGAAMLVPQAAVADGSRDLQLETVLPLDATAGQIPESITTDHFGNLYFSSAATSSIMKRTPRGEVTTLGTLPIAVNTLGVKVGPDGCVYNVSTSLSATPGAFVWRICRPGDVEQFATLDPSGGPNDLAFDDLGNLYVTDPFLGRIYKVDRHGDASVWLQDPRFLGNAASPVLLFHAVGVDGIAFDRLKRSLYVGNLDFGTIYRIEVRFGQPGDVSVFASDPRLTGMDGIAFDVAEDLYVANNAQDTIVTVDRRGNIDTVATGGLLDGPSSLVFGETPFDQHTLYLTSSAFLRAFGLQPGTPMAAILKSPVQRPGLPLP